MKQKLRVFCTLLLLAVASVGWADTYVKVTDANSLSVGDQLLFVAEVSTGESYYVAGDISNSVMTNVEVDVSDNTITTVPEGAVVLTLGGESGKWTFANSEGKLLGATAVKKLAWDKGTTTWSISISDGKATVQNGTNSYGKMLYNVSSPRFAPYTSNPAANMLLIQLYKKEGGSTTETVATPTFTPAAGTYFGTQSVTINTATDGATIYYTTDGTDPTTNSDVYSSAISVSQTTTIKAMAVKNGMENSAVASATYIIVEPFEVEDGVFDFNNSQNYNYGSGYEVGTVKVQSGVWTAGNVTMTTAGRNCWFKSSQDNSMSLRIYKENGNDAAGTLTFAVPEGNVITKIEVQGGNSMNLFTVAPGNYEAGTDNTTGTWTGSATTVTFTATGTAAFSKITITYGEGTPAVEKVDIATIKSISPTTLTVGDLDEFTLDATYAEGVTDDDYTIAWASDNTDVLEVADETYEAKTAGTANVTVTITPTDIDTYNAVSKTFAVTVNAAPVVVGLPFYESFDTNDGTGGNDGSWSGTIASNDFKSDNVDWTPINVTGAYKCVKAGTGKAGGSLTTPELPFVAGKNYVLTFKAAAWNGGSEGTTLTLTASSATLSNAEVTMTKGAWTEYTVYLNDATDAGTVTFAAKNASNNRFFLDEVRIEETNVITVAAPTFSLSQGTYIGEQSVEISCAMEEASIYYTLDGTEPSAQSAIYESAITISENTTLKAIAVKGENVSDVAVAEYTIVVPVHAGTETDPYTIADANLVAAANPENVYVKGIISNIKSLDVSRYKRAQYYISDDGNEENEFYVFNGYYLNGADFTSNSQIQVDDEVVVFGNLTVYNGIKEFAADNYLVSLTRPVTIDATFDEKANNASDFADVYNDNVGGNKNVQMLREFGYDYWNTLVVPFDLTRAQLEEAFGKGVLVAKYTGFDKPANIKFEKTTGDVTRADLLLVKPTATVTNPIFKGVTLEAGKAYTYPEISSSWDGGTLFKITGRFAKQVLTDDDFGKVYFLNKQGKFTHPTAEGKVIRGFRWFIFLKTPESTGAKVTLDLDGEATSIEAIDNGEQAGGKQEIYNLAGQRVQKAQKGIYIVNGKKVVVK